MNETEEQIRQTLDRLEARRSELAAEYGMVTQAINSLEQLLGVQPSIATIDEAQAEPPITQHRASENRLPKFDSAAFFGLSQRDAVVKILRTAGKPMSMLDILVVLKEANYPFKTKFPYQSLYPLMKKDPEIVKHGNLWGLKKNTSTRIPANNGTGNKTDQGAGNGPEDAA